MYRTTDDSPRGCLAVFTLVRDEAIFLPLWLRHYRKQVPARDIYVLDNDTCDGSTDNLEVNVIRASNGGVVDHAFHLATVERMQRELLQRYQYVLFAEGDEFVCVDPRRYRGLADYVNATQPVAVRSVCYEPIHLRGEAPIDWGSPILAQRRRWVGNVVNGMTLNKPLLASVPLSWCPGFHHATNVPDPAIDPDLMLVHLHRVDYEHTRERHRRRSRYKWRKECLEQGLSWHNRLHEGDDFDQWYCRDYAAGEPIPRELQGLL